MGFEEIDGDDDFQEEFACPFCAESYDIIGLCCHIDDEHPLESKNAVCPVCSLKVGVDIVAHITLHHGSLFKISFLIHFLYFTDFLSSYRGITLLCLSSLMSSYMQRKRKSRKNSSNSTLSLLRKELREEDLQRLLGLSSSRNGSPASSGTPDPLLSSFISPTRLHSTPVTRQTRKVSEEKQKERKRVVCISPVSSKDREEKMKKSEFVQRLLSSAIFDEV
ncbi:unnamed protein product [Thlaspi arvense]|uniref:Uncharacterized protein n=1 Tax=Thlaspi arvense TaxID=13288 RepID=A0AAU9RMY4_THLAR|nr:unnamed protein product [Thlaspi arvense]